MAKSKQTQKMEISLVRSSKSSEGALTKTVSNGSPYQLDSAQVQRAATALIRNMKGHARAQEDKSEKKNLAADEDAPEQSDEPIFLTLATKQHVKDSNRLKPNKITLPHSIQPNESRICLITVDPQRQYKDIVADPAFPEGLRTRIGRVIGLGKLKKKYNTYETKRQLLAEYDIFLADDRIIPDLPRVLGKVFHSSKNKRPIPVTLAPQTGKDKDGKRKRAVRSPQEIGKEIESALNSTYIHLSSSATTSIRIGKVSQSPEQIQENIEAVVSALTSKFVTSGWRNIRALHIKGPTTMALPIWLPDELWQDETKVLEEPWKPAIKDGKTKTSEKKRKYEEWEEEMLDEDELAAQRERLSKRKKSKANKEGDEKTKQVGSISKESRRKLKQEALKSVQTPLIAG